MNDDRVILATRHSLARAYDIIEDGLYARERRVRRHLRDAQRNIRRLDAKNGAPDELLAVYFAISARLYRLP